MDEPDISNEISALEQQLSALRSRADEEASSLAALESQLGGLHERLEETRGRLDGHSAKLEEKRAEVVQTEHQPAADAYEEALRARDDAATRVAAAAELVLAELDAYDEAAQTLRALVQSMSLAERNGTGAAGAGDDPEVLLDGWNTLEERVRRRIGEKLDDELVEEAARSAMGRAIDDLPVHLREIAHARRRARIKAHLAKS
jgi:chromosome segregation ATPase